MGREFNSRGATHIRCSTQRSQASGCHCSGSDWLLV